MNKDLQFDKILLNNSAFIFGKNNSIIPAAIISKEYSENSSGIEYFITLLFVINEKIEERRFNVNLIGEQIFLQIEDAKEFLKKRLEQKIDDMCKSAEDQSIMLLSNLRSKGKSHEEQ